jgi:hypothetical protein
MVRGVLGIAEDQSSHDLCRLAVVTSCDMRVGGLGNRRGGVFQPTGDDVNGDACA